MAIIPSDIRFVGISPTVNLTEKKSARINAEQESYTMQDFIDTTGGGGTPAGTDGQIQFNSSSAFGADSNLYWDNTNKRLGVGTSSPLAPLYIYSTNIENAEFKNPSNAVRIRLSGSAYGNIVNSSGQFYIDNNAVGQKIILRGNAGTQINGSGSTSATTALLVQNSSGAQSMTFTDDGVLTVAQPSNTGSPKIRVGTSGFNNDFNQLRMYAAGNLAMAIQPTSIQFSGSGSFAQISWVTNTSLSLSSNDSQVFMNAQGTSFGKGSGAATSSIVEIASTTKGFLPPRMTTAEKLAIASPAAGLQVYDSTLNQMSYYNGSTWVNF